MAFKAILLFTFVLLVKTITGQFVLSCGPPVYDFGPSSCGCGSSFYGYDASSYGYDLSPYGYDASLYGYDLSPYGYDAYGCGCSGFLNSLYSLNSNAATITSSGGNLIVSCCSPRSASGISVSSELVLNGNLDVLGAMPFLSAVGFQSELPSYGTGCVDYSCGNGYNGFTGVTSSLTNLGGSLNSLGGLSNQGGVLTNIGGCSCYY